MQTLVILSGQQNCYTFKSRNEVARDDKDVDTKVTIACYY